jgi:molybdopterin-dependent oxidoreductase alpha subunit
MRNVRIVPPATLTGIRLKHLKDAACGVPAITSTIKHIADEMGMIKGWKLLQKLNQKDGVDCPGCAWPDPTHRSKLGEYCENGAKAIAEEATEKRCTPDFFNQHSVEEMSEWSDYEIGKSGRITNPMFLEKGSSKYKAVSWDFAFQRIAKELDNCATPDEAVFYTSGRTGNEAAFLYQLFVRKFGTNNLPDCSNLCHESSGTALIESLGIGKGTVKLEDLYIADAILVIGQNPGTNHPRMMAALSKCKGNGGKIIHINPLPEVGTTKFIDPQSPVEILKGGTQLADHFLQVRVGGDHALFKMIGHYLKNFEQEIGGVLDQKFIEEKTEGFINYWNSLDEVNLDECSEISGISKAQAFEVAELISKKKNIISCWAMGLTQQKKAVAIIQEVVNIHLVLGAVGKPGAGLCPVRGHSNVQGDRTMGINEKPREPFLLALDKRYNFTAPREHGFDAIEAIDAMSDDKVKIFIGLGGNFVSATPDSVFTGKAMQRVPLTVHISTKLNRSHLVTGEEALILPCLGRTEIDLQEGGEQFVTVENSMGIVHRSRGTIDPASELCMSEPAIVCEIGNACKKTADLPWKKWRSNYDFIREEIEATIPGFDNYNKRVRGADGFYLPNGPREGKFTTPSGKAQFRTEPLQHITVPTGHYVLMTIRTHDQFNTTVYGLDDRYRGVENERRVVMMNEEDILAAGLQHKELVNIIAVHEGVERKAIKFHIIPYDIPKGCVGTYFPETNCLVPLHHTAERSNTPISKFLIVRFEKHNGEEG